jgi:hypothetical protein
MHAKLAPRHSTLALICLFFLQLHRRKRLRPYVVILYIKGSRHCTKRKHPSGFITSRRPEIEIKKHQILSNQSMNERLNPSCFHSKLMKHEFTLETNSPTSKGSWLILEDQTI